MRASNVEDGVNGGANHPIGFSGNIERGTSRHSANTIQSIAMQERVHNTM